MKKYILLLGVLAVAACKGADKPADAPAAAATPAPPPPAPIAPALLTPDSAVLTAKSPSTFTIVLTTTQGDVEILVHRDWSPLGADRMYYLAENGFFKGARFFRVLKGFVAQFGMNGNPAVDAAFEVLPLKDEPVKHSNKRGTVVFAKQSIPNTRTTQLFINLGDNSAGLDPQGFSAVGEVVKGMELVDKFYDQYGEAPDQGMIKSQGNAYLRVQFPLLDSIVATSVKK